MGTVPEYIGMALGKVKFPWAKKISMSSPRQQISAGMKTAMTIFKKTWIYAEWTRGMCGNRSQRDLYWQSLFFVFETPV